MSKSFCLKCLSLLAVILIGTTTVLTGCSSGNSNSTPADATAQTAPASNNGTTKVLKIASTLAPESSTIKLLEEMSKEINEKSGGTLDVQVFPASQLGGLRDFVEGISMGTVEMGMSPMNSLESFDPKFAVYGLPFLFRDDAHVYEFYESEMNQEILEDFRTNKGIRTLGIFNEGFRTVWSSGKPIKTLEDFKGMKMRVPEIPVYVDMFTALGCNATPMPSGDVYTGLQTGVIEGVELPVSSIMLNRFCEVLKYETVTNHCGNPMILLISESMYNKLTDAEKTIVQEAVDKASAQDRKNLEESTQKYYAEAKEIGIEQIILPEEEIVKIQNAMQPVVDKYSEGVISAEMIEQIRAIS